MPINLSLDQKKESEQCPNTFFSTVVISPNGFHAPLKLMTSLITVQNNI